MIFNKIESRITNPSSKHIRFAVVSMDDSNAVKESVKKINDCYSDSEMDDGVFLPLPVRLVDVKSLEKLTPSRKKRLQRGNGERLAKSARTRDEIKFRANS